VFTRTGTTWTQQTKFTPTNHGTNFGTSVSLDGDTALISASFENKNQGSAYVFTRTNTTTWTQQAKLLASDGASMDFFGYSVSLSGDTTIIGSGGGVYVFTRTDTIWTQQTKLLTSETNLYTNFYVSLDGDTALIGTSEDLVFAFIRTDTTWALEQQLLVSDSTSRFGCSVSLDNDTALIGALKAEGNENNAGAAYIFTRSGTTWMQQGKIFAVEGVAGQYFGSSVSLDENTALIAASFWLNTNNSAYIFTIGGENTSPVAGFTWIPTTPSINQQITFDASSSSDFDGFITVYEWDWNADGTYEDSQSIPTATYSWTQVGNYSVTLRVTDDGGTTNTKTITIPIGSEGGNDDTDHNGTPGFQAILLIAAIYATLIMLRRKK
jgi:hypothetical protein